MLSVCLGLRFSEALALRWADVDWLGSRLSIRRGIVNQIVGDVKTQGSAKTFNLASELLERLKSWKQSSQFWERRIGSLPVRSNSGDFLTPTPAQGKSWSGHRRQPELGTSVRTLSGTPTALGWTL